jgi:hypothetical protein
LTTSFKYLKHASLVITDNGSTGWEGLLLQKADHHLGKKPCMTLPG